MNKEIYLNEILDQVPRLLGQLNRNPLSITYGCFDRDYWHYRTVDFPCCRKQEAVLLLALLYNLKNKFNPYYKDKKILKWINAALLFWSKIQEKNGSFNEWYPKENSFVGTAFTSYAISEALLVMGDELSNKKYIMKKLKKSIDWLSNEDELRVQNQQGGAILSIYNFYLLTGILRYKKISEHKINLLFNCQNSEGWFMEYGGADIGYLSLMISYLAKYYRKSKDNKALHMLEKSVKFISYFVYPNFSFGGEVGSRNTEYLIPDGFEITSKLIPESAFISEILKKSVKDRETISPFSQDDRYLCYTSYNFLEAYIYSENAKNKIKRKNFEKIFENAGIYVKNDTKFYTVINYLKGTLHVLFKDTKKELFDDGIYLISKKNKNMYSSFIDRNSEIFKKNDGCIIRGKFDRIPEKNMTTITYILFRGFQLTLGRIKKIGLFVKNILRDVLITKKGKLFGKYERDITFDKNQIIIKDKINDFDKLKKVIISPKSSYIYVPSSRYFNIKEISIDGGTIVYNKKPGKRFLEVERLFDINGKKKVSILFK